jgi:mono/diheme cytochrome c family protein
MNRRRSHFSVLGSRFVFRFGMGAAVICSVAALRVDIVVGRVVVDAPASRVQKDPAYVVQTNDPAYVAQAAARANAGAGQALYSKEGCENCHGPNGQGTAAGPRIAGTARQLPAFVAYVRKPTGTMPPQSAQVVSDRALADIFAFLRSSTVGRVLPDPPGSQVQKDPAYQTTAASTGRTDAGAALYAKIGCYQCHSNQAQGGQAGPRLGPDPIPFARFTQYVRNPTGDMPPYTEKVLSNQELADIYAFVQTRPRPPAVNSIPQLAP